MIDNERKRRIVEHLQQTSNVKVKIKPASVIKSSEPKPAAVEAPAPAPTPPPAPTIAPQTKEGRKKQVMQHLTRSGVNFDLSFSGLEKRKQQIKEHISKSTNKI